jgi:hypothetical protein
LFSQYFVWFAYILYNQHNLIQISLLLHFLLLTISGKSIGKGQQNKQTNAKTGPPISILQGYYSFGKLILKTNAWRNGEGFLWIYMRDKGTFTFKYLRKSQMPHI